MNDAAPRYVCFFNTTGFWGGGELWNLVTARHLRERGHTIHFLTTPGSPLNERATAEGFATSAIPVTNRSLLNPFTYRRIKRTLIDQRIDTIVFNGPKDFKAGGLAARAAGVPIRLFQRGVALPLANHVVNRFMFANVFTHIVANSEATRAALVSEFPAPVPDVEVIYLGVDPNRFNTPAATSDPDRSESASSPAAQPPVVLGSVGRLATEKNHTALIDVAARLKDLGLPFVMRIAGTGTLADSLKAKISSLGLDDEVTLVGFVDDVPSFLRDLDVFLLTSKWEGFGLALVEAGAAGRPAVAFETTSTPEVIAEEETGLLAPLDDIDAFAKQVRRLIEDASLRARLGAAAQMRVRTHFSVEQSIEHLERYLWG